MDNSMDYEEMALLPPDCSSEFRVTTNGCCATFTFNLSSPILEEWDFANGNGMHPLVNSGSPQIFCYPRAGTYTVTRMVRGCTPVSKTFTITTTGCPPPPPACPQILDIGVSWSNANSTDPLCSAAIGGQSDLPESLNFCPFKLTPILNSGNTAGLTFNWLVAFSNTNTNQVCNLNAPQLKVNINGYGFSFTIKLTVSGSCTSQTITKTVTVLNRSCGYTINLRDPSNDDVQALVQKRAIDKNSNIYPNPVDDFLHVSNLKDAEDYTFEIHNALGQTVLGQKVSSIDAVIDVSNLMTGVYIGVLKSQGKIISNNKIYKK